MDTVTPSFIILLITLCLGILFVEKEKMIIPIVIAMLFLPADISIKLMGLDFQALRLIALFGILRIYFIETPQTLQFNTIDKLFISYITLGSIIYIIASEDKVGALIYKSGQYIDSTMLYIVLRHLLHSKKSILLFIKSTSICLIVLLPFAIFEYFSANNLFSILGRSAISIRNGEIRAACTFSHSILFGSFAAAIIPVLWADYITQKSTSRLLSILCCLFYVYVSSSSGPIMALASSIFFLLFFRWKQHGANLAWVILLTATFIHLVRETPIWHFIFVRITIKSSSTGYHRYLLVDAAVKEFWNWWILGYGAQGPKWHEKYWPGAHADFTDVTNHYLLEGVRGGFFTMVIFIILCYVVIKVLGSYAINQINLEDQWLWWGFTVMMITHCITFLSVAYFGQITMLLYLTIAVAAYALDESKTPSKAVVLQK